MVRKGEAMFTLSKSVSTPPYDDVEVLWFHPECFLIWCLDAVLADKGLDSRSSLVLEMMSSALEPLITIK